MFHQGQLKGKFNKKYPLNAVDIQSCVVIECPKGYSNEKCAICVNKNSLLLCCGYVWPLNLIWYQFVYYCTIEMGCVQRVRT